MRKSTHRRARARARSRRRPGVGPATAVDQAGRHRDHGRQRPTRRRHQAPDRQEGHGRPARHPHESGNEVHLHGYDIERNVEKGKPTVIQFVAKVPGRFELELHEPDALLAQLTVEP